MLLASMLLVNVCAVAACSAGERSDGANPWLPATAVIDVTESDVANGQIYFKSTKEVPEVLSAGIDAHYASMGWQRSAVDVPNGPPLEPSTTWRVFQGGGVTYPDESGRLAPTGTKYWLGRWKSPDGQTVTYRLRTASPDKDTDIVGYVLVEKPN